MWLIFAVLLFFNAPTDWQDQTISQSNRYIEVLTRDDQGTGIYHWALTEVFFSNCKVQDHILTKLRNTEIYHYYSGTNSCDDQKNKPATDKKSDILLSISMSEGHSDLFAFFLTQEKDQKIREEKLIVFLEKWRNKLSEQKIKLLTQLAAKEELDETNLSFNGNHLIHLGILTSPHRSELHTEEYLEQAVSYWSELADKPGTQDELEYTLLLANLIGAAYFNYDNDAIISHYQKFLNIKIFPNSSLKIKRLNGIDYTHYILGELEESLYIQRSFSLPITKFLKEESVRNQILTRHGAYLYALGKYQESLAIYEALNKKSDNPYSSSTLFNNLSINYIKLGKKNKYISFQSRALEEASIEKNYEHLLNIYRNLFLFYTSIKDVSTALDYIDKAKEIATENKDNTELALIDSYLGSFYWRTYKDHSEALKYFNSAEEKLSSNKTSKRYTNLLLEKAMIFLKIDSLDLARNFTHHVSEIALSQSNTVSYLEALIILVNIEIIDGNLDEAEKLFDDIKIYTLEDLDFEFLTRYYTLKAEYLYKSGEIREATEYLQPVISQIIDRVKSSTDSQAGYWTVEDEYLEAINLMVKMLTEGENFREALGLLDQLKTINDASLYNNPLVKASKLSEKQLAEEKRLNDRLQDLRKKYLNAGEDKRFALKAEIDRTAAAREEILGNVDLNKEKKLSPIWAIQRSLKTDELLLHFTEVGTDFYITSLTSSSINIQKKPLNKKEQDYFTEIANNLASGKTNLNELYSVYEKLNLDQIPHRIKQITVIPDNYLYRIPLEILPVEKPASSISYGSAKYMIEDYNFRYFTSLQEFESNRRSVANSATEDFSAFAISNFQNLNLGTFNLPSLPYATFEVTNINTALTSFSNKNIYIGNAATKDVFKEKVSTSRMVHVATHSEVSEQDPLFSTIYLKSSHGNDSLESDLALYAYELFDTPLNSEFIMLNSCSSGSGSYMQGTGIMGISRALRYAGAKSLALNLWSVNDKIASEFATDFYTYLNNGDTKSEASRKAKLNQLRSANANPHFWGAYMMIGNSSPMTNEPRKSYLLFSLMATTILLVGYTVRKYEAAA